MPEKLKPCPFCGSENVTLAYNSSRYKRYYYYVSCMICGARTRGEGIYADHVSEEWDNQAAMKSVSCWNQRAVSEQCHGE